ncbi:ABC transporter permease [Mycoplasma feriruminatoris]|uniref:ABC transporter permease n=1 Tax=Mycoplasma feriruminatoris TaxID=1179777 RepID=A0AAQ3HYJ7_9MOLU|nr:ABC transporter permease [Mycoplasma feriruminatoris]WFQ94996.1 ABC transporter permease [Mycoplasma feriruminatoris]
MKTRYKKNRWLGLILKNSLKNSFKYKSQLFGLVLLVMIMSLIMSLISAINSRVLDKYDDLITNSNQHNLVLKLDPYESLPNSLTTSNNQIQAQQQYINRLNDKLYSRYSFKFDWSRTESREFKQVKSLNNLQTLKAVSKQYLTNNKVDQLVISKGRDIRSEKEVVIDPIYAKKHNIKINDIIRFQKDVLGDQLLVNSLENKTTTKQQFEDINKITKQGLTDSNGVYQIKYAGSFDWYQVVGFANSADFIFPTINSYSPIPNRLSEGIVYVDPLRFGLIKQNDGFYRYDSTSAKLVVSSNNEWESFYSLQTNNDISDEIVEWMNQYFNQLINKKLDTKWIYKLEDPNYRFNSRTSVIDKTINAYNIYALIVLLAVISVVLYTTFLITKKQILNSRGQIGTMRAIGYKKRQMVFNYVMMPFFTSIVGGILGYVLSCLISVIIINRFSNYFSLDYGVFSFDWIGLLNNLIFMWLIISAISFLIAYLIMKKGAINLLENRNAKKISKLGSLIKKISSKRKFNHKLRAALLVSSGSKLTGVGFVVLIATMLFTISFVSPNLLKNNKIYAYNGVKYNQVVEYNQPTYNNPFSFIRVFNPDKKSNDTYNVIKNNNKYLATSLPTKNEQYDLQTIIKDYLNQTYNNAYYSLDINLEDKKELDSIQLALANTKLLQAQDIALTKQYFKYISSLSAAPSSINFLLLKNWPDYINLLENLKQTKSDQTLLEQFKYLQQFYATYTNSIGLAINRNYINSFNLKDSEDLRINKFNDSNKDQNKLRIKAYDDVLNDDILSTSKSSLSTETFKQNIASQFKLTNSKSSLGLYHILDNKWNKLDSKSDKFLDISASDFINKKYNENDLKDIVAKLVLWFSVMFYKRDDQALIQAAYSRAPYFVKQNLKISYNSDKDYTLGFNLAPFNKEYEQLGTLLNVKTLDDKHSFKIYGIQNNHDYIDLYDENKTDLIKKLFESDTNSIVINQTIAKRLNLKTNDTISLNVLQNELLHTQNNKTTSFKSTDWSMKQNKNYDSFIQRSQISTNNLKVKTNSSELKLGFDLFSLSDVTSYYQDYLDNKIQLKTKNQIKEFKIVGVHNGYNIPTAWIKENDAQEILNYKQNKNIWWSDIFAPQWNKTFASNDAKVVLNDTLDLNNKSLTDYTYDQFVQEFINNKNHKNHNVAKKVLQIFDNQFPIFNYKYSKSQDIGNLDTIVSTYSKIADYNPVSLNGQHLENKMIYDGIGEGVIQTITPIKITKQILDQISNLVMLALVLAIITILMIVFVIILLTTSLIISDNIRFIATLKVLGYSNKYITENILGMYFIVIANMLVVGFISGWFIFVWTIKSLYPIFVLPIIFPIWLPFAVIFAVSGIYLITLIVGFNSIYKTDATLTLKDTDV